MAIVGVAALGFVLIVVAGLLRANAIEKELGTVRDTYVPKAELAPKLIGQLERISRGFQDAVASRDLDALQANEAHRAEFISDLAAASGALNAADAAALSTALDTYYAAGHDVSRRLIANEVGETLVGAIADMQAKQAHAAALIEKTASLDKRDLTSAFEQIANAVEAEKRYRLWIGVACTLVVLGFSYALSRSVLRSLSALQTGFSRFGRGGFSDAIHTEGRDELRDLADGANQMAASLARFTEEKGRAERRFRTLLEAAPDAMVIVDGTGQIQIVNAQTEQLFGYPRAELLGQSVEILLPQRFRSQHPAYRAGYAKDPRVRAMGAGLDLFGRRRDGTEFPVEISLSPLETDEGLFLSSSIRDISARKNVELALKQSNAELEAFSYSVAHDLRAPLRGINGFSHALLDDYGDKVDAEGKVYLERISAAADRMGLLIDALLSLARVTRKELLREPVDLSEQAASVAKQLQLSQPERVVDFDNQAGVRAEGDPQLLRALLDNLIGNAWKFTGRQAAPRISFGCIQKDDWPVYYVKDNGAGFDMAYASKLFNAFQRLHDAKQFPGTGIGLATVQRIVSRHGGRIWAEGQVDQGATFYFTLTNPGEDHRMITNDKTILLVEDNADDEILMLRAFKKHHILNDVVIARDEVEAIDYLFGEGMHAGRDANVQPQLVLLDLNLPRLGGLDVLRRIRSSERTKYLAVVVLTSSKEEEDILQSYSLGANSYVRKPVDFAAFGDAVKTLGLFWLLLNETAPVPRMTP